MQRYCFIILLLLSVFADLQAQLHYNIYVENPKGDPLEGVKVYSFPTRKLGEKAYDVGKAKYEGIANSGALDDSDLKNFDAVGGVVITQGNGRCQIQAYLSGVIILDGGDCSRGTYNFERYYVADYIKDKKSFDINLVLHGEDHISDKDKTAPWRKEGDVTKMDQVETTGIPAMSKIGKCLGRHGSNITITAGVDIDGEYARSDARFVAFPKIEFTSYKDSFIYLPPLVVKGEDFAKNRIRRMSFKQSRDLLDGFDYDAAVFLDDHQNDHVLYEQEVAITKGTLYRVPCILWYEDNNGVYHQDSLLFNDGKEAEPMRFLNWESARQFATIDPSRFQKQGSYSTSNTSADFNIQFVTGKAAINESDSLTVAQRDSLLRWVRKYKSKPGAQIEEIIVRGYSSPEGSESLNRRLSRDRANTIKSLLVSGLGGDVKVTTSFDSHDNIVPWDSIASKMLFMEDSTARRYAEEINLLVSGITSIDAQNRVIMANKELYAYVKNNKILETVRRVEIEASISEQKILEPHEIIDRYYNDPVFRETMVAPYQFYHLITYLVGKEDWNELYNVSKRAYELLRKEEYVTKTVRVSQDDSIAKLRNDYVPYPYAGYYYAVSAMRKGLVDTEILKPYLDDGPVDETGNSRRGNAGAINTLPFIVGQVLMYCQGENYDEADNLIAKYNLQAYPSLTGLIMFVLCLDGQYAERQDVRDYVMSTSIMNKAVILAALGKYNEALVVLYSSDVPKNDAKVEYLKAICHFNRLSSQQTNIEYSAGYSGRALYVAEDDDDNTAGQSRDDWAAPMLNAIRLEPSYAQYLERDGYFNNAYRQMIFYFLKRSQQGVAPDRIVAEYNALVSEMRKKSSKE